MFKSCFEGQKKRFKKKYIAMITENSNKFYELDIYAEVHWSYRVAQKIQI